MKAIIAKILFWLCLITIILLSVMIWFILAFKPVMQTKKEVQERITFSNNTLLQLQINSTLAPEMILKQSEIVDSNRVSALIQDATHSQVEHFELLNSKQIKLADQTTLSNIQLDQLAGKNLEAVMYSINAQATYQEAREFLIMLEKEPGIFIQNVDYIVSNYPEGTLSITFKIYRLS
jgi:hypothetical protein